MNSTFPYTGLFSGPNPTLTGWVTSNKLLAGATDPVVPSGLVCPQPVAYRTITVPAGAGTVPPAPPAGPLKLPS